MSKRLTILLFAVSAYRKWHKLTFECLCSPDHIFGLAKLILSNEISFESWISQLKHYISVIKHFSIFQEHRSRFCLHHFLGGTHCRLTTSSRGPGTGHGWSWHVAGSPVLGQKQYENGRFCKITRRADTNAYTLPGWKWLKNCSCDWSFDPFAIIEFA